MKEISEIYNHYKNSAKKRGIEFTLTKEQLHSLSFPITCPVLGIPLKYNRGKPQYDSYSLDRIDSTKGYAMDNVVVISHRANTLKNNATIDELRQMVKFYDALANEK